MIQLTRIDGRVLMLNAELIETVESTPDTVVTLTTGTKYIIKETLEHIAAAVMRYQQEKHQQQSTKPVQRVLRLKK